MEDQTLPINHGFRKLKVPCPHLRERQATVNKVAPFQTVTNKAPPELLFAPVMRPVNIYKCSHFQTLSPCDRRKHVKNLKLCFNCFGSHHVQHCNSKNVC